MTAHYNGDDPSLREEAERLREQHRQSEYENNPEIQPLLQLAGLTPVAGPFLLPTAGLAEVRGAVARQIAQFLRQRLDEPPPRIMVTGSPGVGKTHEICVTIPNIIAADKHMKRAHRVIYAVPMHRLGRQIIARFTQRFTKAGLKVAVYEGRGVSDSERGEDGALADGRMPLCRNPLDVKLALSVGADIVKTVCGTTKKEQGKSLPACKFRHDCKWWQQLGECSKADIVFVAHNFLFERIPEIVRENVGTIVIDEDPAAHGDGTITLAMSEFGEVALAANPVRHTAKGKKNKPNPNFGRPDPAKTAELQQHFVAIVNALDQVGQGIPLRAALAGQGLTTELLKQICKLNWKRRINPGMWPGMPLAEREEAAKRGRINPLLRKMHALLSACVEAEDNISERLEVHGSAITVYRLRPAAEWTDSRSILLASASARPELLAQHFPGLQHTPAPMPAAPFQTVHQHLGAFGREATTRKLPQLLPEAEAIIAGRRALVVTHMPCAEATRNALPGVAVRYHGGTVGDDDFGNVDVLLVYGGAFAKPKDAIRLASAEAGRIIRPARPVKTAAVALLADGSGVQFDRLAYADEVAQAVHRGIYDTSIEQAIGRARGLNRMAVNPVEVHVFANCPLPMPVASINRWRRPSRFAQMLWRGVVPLSAAGMARRYPELFPSAEAARTAKHRWGGEAAILNELRPEADRLPYPTAVITLQLAGRGQRRTRLIVARDRVEELRREAEREFGGLVSWHVAAFSGGTRRPPAGKEDRDISGKRALFPELSQSSRRVPPPRLPIAPTTAPRAPPD